MTLMKFNAKIAALRLCSLLMGLGLLFAMPALAQERVAGGSSDQQSTWSALESQLKGTIDRTAGVGGRIDIITACGKRGLIYAPGVAGADSQNCMAPQLPASVINSINTLNSSVTNSKVNVTKILNCNAQGQTYNAASGVCQSVITPASVVKIQASSVAIKGNGQYASYAVATCPAGTSLIGCSGARNPSITDTCDESECGLIGYGPTNDNTCMTTVDDDTGTRATVWATCLKTN